MKQKSSPHEEEAAAKTTCDELTTAPILGEEREREIGSEIGPRRRKVEAFRRFVLTSPSSHSDLNIH